MNHLFPIKIYNYQIYNILSYKVLNMKYLNFDNSERILFQTDYLFNQI